MARDRYRSRSRERHTSDRHSKEQRNHPRDEKERDDKHNRRHERGDREYTHRDRVDQRSQSWNHKSGTKSKHHRDSYEARQNQYSKHGNDSNSSRRRENDLERDRSRHKDNRFRERERSIDKGRGNHRDRNEASSRSKPKYSDRFRDRRRSVDRDRRYDHTEGRRHHDDRKADRSSRRRDSERGRRSDRDRSSISSSASKSARKEKVVEGRDEDKDVERNREIDTYPVEESERHSRHSDSECRSGSVDSNIDAKEDSASVTTPSSAMETPQSKISGEWKGFPCPCIYPGQVKFYDAKYEDPYQSIVPLFAMPTKGPNVKRYLSSKVYEPRLDAGRTAWLQQMEALLDSNLKYIGLKMEALEFNEEWNSLMVMPSVEL